MLCRFHEMRCFDLIDFFFLKNNIGTLEYRLITARFQVVAEINEMKEEATIAANQPKVR